MSITQQINLVVSLGRAIQLADARQFTLSRMGRKFVTFSGKDFHCDVSKPSLSLIFTPFLGYLSISCLSYFFFPPSDLFVCLFVITGSGALGQHDDVASSRAT
jgi:hypothetical protein